MIIKRGIGAAVAVGATTLLLSGCVTGGGGAESPSDAVDGTGEISGEIGISWWGGDPRHQKTNAVIDMFEAQNPGVTSDRQGSDWGSYWDKLNVQASSDSLPCAIQLQGRQLNDYTKYDLLLPLDPMIESGAIDVENIPEVALDAARGTDGKLYFLPYGVAYDAVGVNETLAEEAGVGVPEPGYTWDDYFDWASEAADALPDRARAISAGGGKQNYFIGWALANGIPVFGEDGKLGFTEDTLRDWWQKWEDLRAAGVTETAERSAEEPAAGDQGYFATGAVLSDTVPGNALTPMSITMKGIGNDTLTTVAYPSGSVGAGNALYPSGFAIPRSCDNVATAAAFIDFFTNDVDAGIEFAGDNGAPTNTKVLDALLADDTMPDTKKHELELYQEILENDPPTIVFPPGYQATFEASFVRAYEDIIFGRASIDDAVATFFAEANGSLGE